MRRKIVTIIILLVTLTALVAVGIYFKNMTQDDGVFTVILDPGHGGDDPGAVAGEIYEKEINREVAIMVRNLLKPNEDIVVKMTREEDVFLSLPQRAQFANKQNADLFVSIHTNALEDPFFSGIMTFHHTEKSNGKNPAKMIQAALVEATGAVDRGVRRERYTVLQETEMPAVLVEVGFMTNAGELALLTEQSYQQKLAEGIAEGIFAYAGYEKWEWN